MKQDRLPTRPVIRYHGGKWRIAPWIISHFPPHRVYVEPFGGGGSVLARKNRCPTEVYNDLDERVVNLFRVLRDQAGSAELIRRVCLTPFARAEYEDWCFEDPRDSIDSAHQMLCASWFGQSSKGRNIRSGFDTRINPADGYCSRERAYRALPEAIRSFSERFCGVIVERGDATKVMQRFDGPATLHYVDPPYITSTHSSKVYANYLTDADHAALGAVLLGLQGMVVVSGYPHPLYDEMFAGWKRREIKALADGALERTEVLWINPAAVAGSVQPCMLDLMETT